MAVTYGATEHSAQLSRAMSRTVSFDLYDSDGDEEYDYLPLPEVDEDFLDDPDALTQTATSAGSRKEDLKFFCILMRVAVAAEWVF